MSLSDEEISAVVSAQFVAAQTFQETRFDERRRLARDYYDGKPFGNERPDRSKAILTDVRDKIEALMPSLMKVFISGDKIVRFDPNSEEDKPLSEQATDVVNHVFMEQNNGFLILYSYFKDALKEITGITKVFVEEVEEVTTDMRTGLLPDDLQELEDEEGTEVEIEETKPGEIDGIEVELTDARVTKTRMVNNIIVKNIEPRRFKITETVDSVDISKAAYVAEECPAFVSDLIEQGFDRDLVEDLPSIEFDEIEDEDDTAIAARTIDRSMRRVLVTEHYIRMDVDETGVAKKWKITTGGPGHDVLDKEIFEDEWPYQVIVPIITPHEFDGISLAEEVMDLQLIKSTMLREMLDNVYGINNNRLKVWQSQANQIDIDEVLANEFGGVIQINAPPGQADVQNIEINPVHDAVLPVIEYLDNVGEIRTGVTRYNQGLDTDSLNKTATGITRIMSAAQEKEQLIARIFGETGLKQIFAAIYRNARKYQAGERSFRLRNEFVKIDPGKWPANFDLTIQVGLGTGNKIEQAQSAAELLKTVTIAFDRGLATVEHVYNAFEAFVNAIGFKDASQFAIDPESQEGKRLLEQRARNMQNKPDPLMQKIEADMQVAAAEIERKRQADTAENDRKRQADEDKTRIAMAKLTEDVRTDQDKMINDFAIDRQKLLADFRIDTQKLLLDAQIEQAKMTREAVSEAAELAVERSLKQKELEVQAALSLTKIAADKSSRDDEMAIDAVTSLADTGANIRTDIRDPGDS